MVAALTYEKEIMSLLDCDFIGALTIALQRAITFVHSDTACIVARFNVFTESLPSNALAIHVTIC
jgi:hypothetical protein